MTPEQLGRFTGYLIAVLITVFLASIVIAAAVVWVRFLFGLAW